MKRAFTLLISALLIACTSSHKQVRIGQRLSILDSMLSKNPSAVYDSLLKIESQKLSSENRAYYSLLKTIAQDKIDFSFTSDSLITYAVNWYEESSDNYNLTRSLTYKGIVRYTLDPKDTISFDLFKSAEQLYSKHKLRDNHLLGMIYAYLGKINKADKNFVEAEKYFVRSAQINKASGNTYNYIVSLMDIIWTKINLRDYKNIPSYINDLDLSKYPF